MTPQPYYADDTVELYLGDMREVLPALDIQADCVVADPPYGETKLAWDHWPDGWLEVAAAAARSLWCFGSWRVFGPRWQEFLAAGWKPSQDIVWEKPVGSSFVADRFRRVHETATHWYRGPWGEQHRDVPRIPAADPTDIRTDRIRNAPGKGHYDALSVGPSVRRFDGTRMQRSVIRAPQVRGGHPTEKPVALLRDLVHYSCPPGGTVLDPFAGSGSTLAAARETGRRAIGAEAYEPYAEAAARRLAQGVLPLGGEP